MDAHAAQAHEESIAINCTTDLRLEICVGQSEAWAKRRRDSGGVHAGSRQHSLSIPFGASSYPTVEPSQGHAFRDHASAASRDYFLPKPWGGLCWPRDELNPDEAGATTFLLAFGFFFSRVLRF
jgi:hypothetical protein